MDAYIGQIQLFAFNYAPMYWVRCDGQSLPVAQNQALYALIGNTYGGNNVNFNLPKLNDAAMVPGNLYYYIAVAGIFPSRD